MEVTVECQKRPEGVNPRALRRSGKIPAVLYGHEGTESVPLTINVKTAETLLKQADVNHTLIQVNIPDLPWKGKALLREVQTHPWKSQLYHLSFFSMASQDSVNVTLPLALQGEAPGIKAGGILEQLMIEINVECDPDKIPETIEIDISNLGIGDSIHVHELVLPEGLSAKEDAERIVLSVAAPAVAAQETSEESAAEG
ncbi:MAG: 50S ribosomal protein L25/general stress protein Ctc [Symploca sp. SIO2B6]|nr:50S ribosomal protein L25/general stress protein Ctc [Symploca sp. SIO2B6]